MPTSAAGSRHTGHAPPRACRRRAGFTLLELLVVIAIIALATAGVGLALRDSGDAALEREAERLAALLEAGRAQSRASGVAVRWRPTPEGPADFVFDGLPPGALPDRWLNPDTVARPLAFDGSAVPALQLGPDPIIAAQRVAIGRPPAAETRLFVGTDGLHPFSVSPP